MSSTYTKQEQVYLKQVGQRIREARLKTELSQEKFVSICKLDRTYISDIERGQRNISVLNLKKIAKALKISVGELV